MFEKQIKIKADSNQNQPKRGTSDRDRYRFSKNLSLTNRTKVRWYVILLPFTVFGIASFLYILLNLTGYSFFLVSCQSHSMHPIMDCNDFVVLKKFNVQPFVEKLSAGDSLINVVVEEELQKEIVIGDIISFYENPSSNVIHQVIDFCSTGPITKGINNTVADGCIDYNHVLGKVIWFWHN